MDQTSGTWLWITGAKNLELRLIHLPTGVIIDVDGAAVVLKREGKMTYREHKPALERLREEP